jgi:hypothetical protein
MIQLRIALNWARVVIFMLSGVDVEIDRELGILRGPL